jgi:hypothetical protein
MAELKQVEPDRGGCCSNEAEQACCGPDAKSECCREGHPQKCGCEARERREP